MVLHKLMRVTNCTFLRDNLMIVYLGDNLMMLIKQFLLCTLFKVVISAREWESTKMFRTIMSQFINFFLNCTVFDQKMPFRTVLTRA